MKSLITKTLIIIALFAIIGFQSAHAGKMHYYKDSSQNVYRICKDRDGYVVYKPGGGTDAWGNGYSWSDVKKAYGLGKWFKRPSRNYSNCP